MLEWGFLHTAGHFPRIFYRNLGLFEEEAAACWGLVLTSFKHVQPIIAALMALDKLSNLPAQK
jgi:hypothetical protein